MQFEIGISDCNGVFGRNYRTIVVNTSSEAQARTQAHKYIKTWDLIDAEIEHIEKM